MNDTSVVNKGCWLTVLHASRIPPHVGLMIDGNYNSLTIKERELNVKSEVLLKTIAQKKIETLFIKLVKQPVFSKEYQLLTFQEQLNQFTTVKSNEATCLSPVKLFFEEFYAVEYRSEMLFFDLMEKLNDNNYIDSINGVNIKNANEDSLFTFRTYTMEKLWEIIEQETKNQ